MTVRSREQATDPSGKRGHAKASRQLETNELSVLACAYHHANVILSGIRCLPRDAQRRLLASEQLGIATSPSSSLVLVGFHFLQHKARLPTMADHGSTRNSARDLSRIRGLFNGFTPRTLRSNIPQYSHDYTISQYRSRTHTTSRFCTQDYKVRMIHVPTHVRTTDPNSHTTRHGGLVMPTTSDAA